MLVRLQKLSDSRHADDYSLNRALRTHLRVTCNFLRFLSLSLSISHLPPSLPPSLFSSPSLPLQLSSLALSSLSFLCFCYQPLLSLKVLICAISLPSTYLDSFVLSHTHLSLTRSFSRLCNLTLLFSTFFPCTSPSCSLSDLSHSSLSLTDPHSLSAGSEEESRSRGRYLEEDRPGHPSPSKIRGRLLCLCEGQIPSQI